MARSDIKRFSFPLPWWAVIPPAAAVGIISALWVGKSLGWWYMSLSQLSLLPQESVMITGPLACMTSAAVGSWFLDPRSPLAAPHVTRSAGGLHLRVLACLACWLGGALLLGAGVMSLLGWLRSTGGQYYPVEALIALPKLLAFVTSGLIIGLLVGRRLAAIAALAWSLFWDLGVLILVQSIGATAEPQSIFGTVLMWTMVMDHHISAPWLLGLVALWWLCVVGLLAALLWAVGHWRARAGGLPVALSGAGVVAVCATGGLLLASSTPLTGPGQLPAAVCQEAVGSSYDVCVTAEQRTALKRVASSVATVAQRLGAWPGEALPIVATSPAMYSLRAAGQPSAGEVLVIPLRPEGTGSIARIVAREVSGYATCPGNGGPGDPSRGLGTEWSGALADLLTGGPPRDGSSSGPQAAALAGLTTNALSAWYTQNSATLLACEYEGPGPQ